jgi:hypothetical protein
MSDPRADPDFNPARSIFGFEVVGYNTFGQNFYYVHPAIFGLSYCGPSVAGLVVDIALIDFVDGNPFSDPHPGRPRIPLCCARVIGRHQFRVIFQGQRGKQRTRRMTAYDASIKPHLEPWISKFQQANIFWSLLNDTDKAYFNDTARSTGLAWCGHNLFTKWFMQDDPRILDYV